MTDRPRWNVRMRNANDPSEFKMLKMLRRRAISIIYIPLDWVSVVAVAASVFLSFWLRLGQISRHWSKSTKVALPLRSPHYITHWEKGSNLTLTHSRSQHTDLHSHSFFSPHNTHNKRHTLNVEKKWGKRQTRVLPISVSVSPGAGANTDSGVRRKWLFE